MKLWSTGRLLMMLLLPAVCFSEVCAQQNKELKEVTVTGATAERRLDMLLIYPLASLKEQSADAADLIARMELPGLYLDRRNDKLASVRKGGIIYRINGAPASEQEFQAVDPMRVKRVEYHDNPDLRFKGAAAVVDIYVSRPPVGLNGNIFGMQGVVNRNKGSYNGSLKVNSGKSEWTMGARYEYGRFSRYSSESHTRFTMDDGSTLDRFSEQYPNKFKEDYVTSYASYSYMKDKSLVLVKGGLGYYGSPETDVRGVQRYGSRAEECYRSYKSSKDMRPSLDVYFQHETENKNMIMVDIVYEYMDVSSDYTAEYEQSGRVITDITGKKHSAGAQVETALRLGKGRLSAGIKENFQKASNDYSGSIYSRNRQTLSESSIYAQWNGAIGKLDYSAGAKGMMRLFDNSGERNRELSLQPQARTRYNLTTRMSIALDANIDVRNPLLGSSGNSIVKENELNYRAGNSMLDPQQSYGGRLSAMYYSGQCYSEIEIGADYINNPLMNDVIREENRFITMMVNGTCATRFSVSYAGRIRMFNRLSLSPRIGYDHYDYNLGGLHRKCAGWSVKGSVSWNLNPFTLSLDYFGRSKRLSGGLSQNRSISYLIASAGWSRNGLRLGITFELPLNSFSQSVIQTPVMSQITNSWQGGKRPVITARAGWSFSVNQRNSHPDKRLYHSDMDNGIL